MSAFDDLLNLDGPSEGSVDSSNPFDPYSGQSSKQIAGTASGDLLGLGFGDQISSENAVQISFDPNTNPLYEFNNSNIKMATDSSNQLLDMDSEPVQKDLKSENTNMLYDFMQNESVTNGHAEEGLTNGAEQDLLGGEEIGGGEENLLGEDQNGGGEEDLLGGDQSGRDQEDDFLGGGEDSGVHDGDLLGGDYNDSNVTSERQQEEEYLEQEQEVDLMTEGDAGNMAEDTGDLLEQSGPVGDETVEVADEEDQPGEVMQRSEISEPEQESEQVEIQPEPVVAEEESSAVNDSDQPSGPVGEGPGEENITEEEMVAEEQMDIETVLPVDEGTKDEVQKSQETDELVEQVDATVEETEDKAELEVEPAEESQPELEAEAHDQFDEAEPAKDVIVDEEEVIESQKAADIEVQPTASENLDEPEPEIEEKEEKHIEEPAEETVKETEDVPAPVYDGIGDMNENQAEPEVEHVPAVTDDNQADLDNQKEEARDEIVTDAEAVDMKEQPEQPDEIQSAEQTEVTEEVGDDAGTRRGFEAEVQDDAVRVNGTSEVDENGITEEEAVRDPNVFRETHEKEEVHFAEMNNVRQKFESGATHDEPAPRRISVKEEYAEGGEYENKPVPNPDVVKEIDQPKEELPEIGMAKNLVNRFKSISEENSQPVSSGRKPSPPRQSEKVEYESTPTEHLPQYESKSEAGVFESEPKGREDVVRSGDQSEDFKPEQGYAKNILGKFKEIETQSKTYKPNEKREITPDRSGKVEYVSEPRGQRIEYNETQTESGVFENVPKEEEDVVRSGERPQEILPEVGTAKSLLSKFKQMETESGFKPPPSPKREITPDRSGKVEYVSEPRGFLEKYEPKIESGEFESHPTTHAEVVRSGDHGEEILPEVGSAKKTMERFKEIQRQSSSPSSARTKEFTPPRETSPGRTVAGVVENTPKERGDVVKSGEVGPDDRPAQGTTKNILNKYKEIASSGSQSSSPGRKPKEFTPPPEAGVYENTPKEHLIVETRQSESGILESTPTKSTADIAREREATPEAELPEQGFAKNMVSKWKQLESTSGSAKSTSSTSPRFKEFTPPRDSRGPMSPKSPVGATTNGVHPRDLPGQYQPQESSVIVENQPQVNKDVYREADTDWTEGMPAPNTTASLLQRFKSIQDEAKEAEATPPVTHVTRKDDSLSYPDSEEKGMFKVVQTEKCAACQKTVYAMEKLEMNGHIYHKNCFKCSHCSARLTPKTFSMNEGVIYCVNHFKQLFARKGNYDEGFGRQQYKKKWGAGEKSEGATA